MPVSKHGKKYIVTICDNFSRFLYCHPCVRDRAEDAVSALENFVLEYGIPTVIHSDRGVHFINALFDRFCANFNVKHAVHAAYRPQSSGQLERIHRSLKNTIWILCNDSDLEWTEALPYARRAHNISYNASTKVSPYFCVYGKNPNITGLMNITETSRNPHDFGKNQATILQKAYKAIKISQSGADLALRKRNEPHFEVTPINIGDLVYLKRDQSVAAKNTHLEWIGPFRVNNVSDCIVEIQKNENSKDFVHRTHVIKKIDRFEYLAPPVASEPVKGSVSNEIEGAPVCDDSRESYKDILLKNNIVSPSNLLKRSRLPPKKLQIQPTNKTYED